MGLNLIKAILLDIFLPNWDIIFYIFKNNKFFLSYLTFSNIEFWHVVLPPIRYAMPNCKIAKINVRSYVYINVCINNYATLDYIKNICADIIAFGSY